MLVKVEVLSPLTTSIEISTFDVPTSSICTLFVSSDLVPDYYQSYLSFPVGVNLYAFAV